MYEHCKSDEAPRNGLEEMPYPKTDGSGYGRQTSENHGGKPVFNAGQRGGFVNGRGTRLAADDAEQGMGDQPDQGVVRRPQWAMT